MQEHLFGHTPCMHVGIHVGMTTYNKIYQQTLMNCMHACVFWLLCRQDHHEDLAALFLYLVRKRHLDLARDIIFIMLVNK